MRKKVKHKSITINKVTSKKEIKDYAKDPYFVQKREAAVTFLKKAGVPESFAKPQDK